MITFFIKLFRFISIAALFLPGNLFAQEGLFGVWHPEISSTWKFSGRWDLNIKTTAFNVIAEPGTEGFLSDYNLDFLEISSIISYKFFNNPSVGIGFLYRWSDPLEDEYQFEKRLTWQLGIVTRSGPARFGHRFRIEQRWVKPGLVNRFRYRFSVDKPLRGESLDPGEPYFIASNELLFSAGEPIESFGENRLNLGSGWMFSSRTKLELQAQYRLNGISGSDLVHLLVVYTTLYLNL